MALSLRKSFILLFLAALIGSAVAAYLHFAEGAPPTARLDTEATHFTSGSPLALRVEDQGRGLRNVKVFAVQEDNRLLLLEQDFPKARYAWSGEVALPAKGLKDGPMELEVRSTDRSLADWGEGNTSVFRHEMIFDATPPRLSVISDAHNLNQGGSGLIVYALSEEVTNSGVMVNDLFFPGYPQDSGVYFCLFTMPFDLDPTKNRPVLTAVDLAENSAQTTFYYHGNRRSFRQDTLNISQSFLENVMPHFQNAFPDAQSLLDLYLLVNRDLREENAAFLRSLAGDTSPVPLWDQVFIRQPRAAPRAGFADKRTYMHEGEVIDRQVHMGIDLASTAFDEIIAANRGRVIFTGDLGIYGQTVILDHGLGLHSLYAHLSQIQTADGEMLERGQILGRSGMTGLAAGDHLHFEMLVSGVPVNPVEWWDEQWIRHNIWSKTGIAVGSDQP